MVSAEAMAYSVVQALYIGTWAIIVAFLVWLVHIIRATAPELIQLRIMQELPGFQRGFTSLTLGSLAGAIGLAPWVLVMSPSAAWVALWTVPWSAATNYGVFTLLRLLRIRRDATSAPKSSRDAGLRT